MLARYVTVVEYRLTVSVNIVTQFQTGPVARIRTVYYIHGPKLMKLHCCRFIPVTNDGPYTLL